MRPFPSSTVQRIRLPIIDSTGIRIAELSGRAIISGARAFPSSRWRELAIFGPNVLVGAAAELARFVERLDLKTLELSSVDHGVFVITEIGDGPLTDKMRVVLWQRFGVPVYELYLGPRLQLLGAECEAQLGWHVQPDVQFCRHEGLLALETAEGTIGTGLDSYLDESPCPCGKPGARIVDSDRARGVLEPVLAATA